MTPAWRIERAPSWLLTRAADACLRGSDYQTGGWDTDAAENIAYDASAARAFIASAESGVIKVVDMSNPTSITEVGTLNVGTQLSTQCMEVDCIYERMDFGGRHNPCGYGTMLANVVNYGTVDVRRSPLRRESNSRVRLCALAARPADSVRSCVLVRVHSSSVALRTVRTATTASRRM